MTTKTFNRAVKSEIWGEFLLYERQLQYKFPSKINEFPSNFTKTLNTNKAILYSVLLNNRAIKTSNYEHFAACCQLDEWIIVGI